MAKVYSTCVDDDATRGRRSDQSHHPSHLRLPLLNLVLVATFTVYHGGNENKIFDISPGISSHLGVKVLTQNAVGRLQGLQIPPQR